MIPVNDVSRRPSPIPAIERVVKSGQYIHGPEHEAFEDEFADYLGVSHVAGCANGTDALELALRAVGVEKQNRVLTAANAGGYASTAIERIGAVPVYGDVSIETASISVEEVRRHVQTNSVNAVVVTHLYGLMGEVEEINYLCRSKGILLVEDCAQAPGAHRGMMAGAYGDASAFSFYPTKNLGAVGDGGAVATQNPRVVERVRMLRQYGWLHKYSPIVSGGWNSRLDEIQAAVLRDRLPSLDRGNSLRRSTVIEYRASLRSKAGSFIASFDGDYVGHLAVVIAKDRKKFMDASERHGVGTAIHYPASDHTYRFGQANLEVTDYLRDHVVTIPCFPEMTREEIRHVCAFLESL